MFNKTNFIYASVILVILLGCIIVIFRVSKKENVTELTNQEALIIGESFYDKAMDYYWCNFNYDNDGSIVGYNEIINIFTSNGILNFEKTLGVTKIKGKAFEKESSCARGSDISYDETKLSIVKIEKDLIEFKASSLYCKNNDNDVCSLNEIKDNKFILKKVDELWKVDEFVLPN